VSALRRLAHLIWGAEIDRALRPVLAISLAGSIAGSTWWTFMGIWAVTVLDAKAALPFVFGVGAVLAATSGYLGGSLSDHFGRRRIMLVGEGVMVAYPLVLLAIGDRHTPGLVALACAGAFGALGGSVSQALVADVVAPENHEEAYAAVRVASNLGVTVGPPVGALMLFAGDWRLLFICVSVLSAAAFVIAFRYLPRRGMFAPDAPPDRGSFGVIRRDASFLLFMGSAVFAWIVYVAYQEILPISLVDSYGFAPAAWGLLIVINPLLVTLFQLRLTRSVEHVPAAPRLVTAMLVMGLPFLLLIASASLAVVMLVITLFVVGEMLWVPTSQSIVAALAPADLRGAYMGAFGSTAAVGFALAPMVGLSVRNAYGDNPMWLMFAALGIVAAVLGGAACEGVRRRSPGQAMAPARS
jgi:predicted MFS family arabinose efflux permease